MTCTWLLVGHNGNGLQAFQSQPQVVFRRGEVFQFAWPLEVDKKCGFDAGVCKTTLGVPCATLPMAGSSPEGQLWASATINKFRPGASRWAKNMFAHMHNAYACVCEYVYAYVYVYVCVCVRVCIHICVCIFVGIYTYAHMCACMYVDAYSRGM